jgi:hypothetical protein
MGATDKNGKFHPDEEFRSKALINCFEQYQKMQRKSIEELARQPRNTSREQRPSNCG